MRRNEKDLHNNNLIPKAPEKETRKAPQIPREVLQGLPWAGEMIAAPKRVSSSRPVPKSEMPLRGGFTRLQRCGLVSFISLPCSFAIGLGLTEALHVGPYQRDLASSPARIG